MRGATRFVYGVALVAGLMMIRPVWRTYPEGGLRLPCEVDVESSRLGKSNEATRGDG